jgi:hypothetical protein
MGRPFVVKPGYDMILMSMSEVINPNVLDNTHMSERLVSLCPFHDKLTALLNNI